MSSLTPHFARDVNASDLADTASLVAHLYFPEAAIITQIAATNLSAIAAHATTVATVTVTDLGVAGAGSTVVGVITNDSDLADSTTRTSQAYAAKIASVLDLGTDSTAGYEVAAGSVVAVSVANATGGALADFTASLFYRPGQN